MKDKIIYGKEELATNAEIIVYLCDSKFSAPHTHKFFELAYVLKGSALHKINNSEEQLISEGDFFIIDYQTEHGYKSVGEGDLVLINCLFLPQFVDKSLTYCRDFRTLMRHYLIQIDSSYSKLTIADSVFHDSSGIILTLIKEMLDEYNGSNLGRKELIRLKMIELLIQTARMQSSLGTADIIDKILLRINKEYNTGLSLGDIAEELNYSLPYLSKLFKDRTGHTFMAYLQKLRVSEACRLLINTDETANCISKLVGYSDYDYFCKVFRKSTDLMPTAFRKKFKSQ